MPRLVNHDEKREEFAAAALRVIMRDGIGGLTVRAVASEAGFTTGALTHYFRSKDQLLIEASELSGPPVRQKMEEIEVTDPAIDALRRVVALALPLGPEMRGYWRVWLGFWERSSHDREVNRVMAVRYAEWKGRIHTLLKRARAAGDIRGDVDLAAATASLVALVDGIGVQVVLGISPLAPAKQRRLVEDWLAGVRSPLTTIPAGRARRIPSATTAS